MFARVGVQILCWPRTFAYCELLPRDLQLFPDDGVSFVEVKGGTGAMLSKLKDGSLEACVALTEWCVCLFKSRSLLFITAGLSLVAADLSKGIRCHVMPMLRRPDRRSRVQSGRGDREGHRPCVADDICHSTACLGHHCRPGPQDRCVVDGMGWDGMGPMAGRQ
jgi:hypothetical protein